MKKQIISVLIATTTVGAIGKIVVDNDVITKYSNELKEIAITTSASIVEKREFIESTSQDAEIKITELQTISEKLKTDIEAEINRQKRTIEFTLTFYTTLDEENGWGPINCLGEPLAAGMVANNVIPLGTKIDLGENYGIVEVRDRGGKNFDVAHRLDFLVMRNAGESDQEYYRRVNNYGIKKVTGYILEE